MSQKEYNEIYHGPLIEFAHINKDRQLAFLAMAPKITRDGLMRFIKNNRGA